MNEYPIRLKPDDQPAPAAPETAAFQLADQIRTLFGDLVDARDTVVHWTSADHEPLRRRLQNRLIDMVEQAGRIGDDFERYQQSRRHAGDFSAAYSSDDLGVR